MSVDYSSKTYWRDRLSREQDNGFEWLIPSSDILSTIAKVVDELTPTSTPISILHFGCGSSTLGVDLQRHLGDGAVVSDADYASSSLYARESASTLPDCTHPPRQVPLFDVDVLDLDSMRSIAPADGWDLVVDKSTADAISCAPPLPISLPSQATPSAAQVEALEVLCSNLGAVASCHCRWVSISYSATRFDFLTHQPVGGWRVVSKFPARLQPTTSTKEEGHIVHQPVTGTWVWVLARQ
jgi:hypothetical protein